MITFVLLLLWALALSIKSTAAATASIIEDPIHSLNKSLPHPKVIYPPSKSPETHISSPGLLRRQHNLPGISTLTDLLTENWTFQCERFDSTLSRPRFQRSRIPGLNFHVFTNPTPDQLSIQQTHRNTYNNFLHDTCEHRCTCIPSPRDANGSNGQAHIIDCTISMGEVAEYAASLGGRSGRSDAAKMGDAWAHLQPLLQACATVCRCVTMYRKEKEKEPKGVVSTDPRYYASGNGVAGGSWGPDNMGLGVFRPGGDGFGGGGRYGGGGGGMSDSFGDVRGPDGAVMGFDPDATEPFLIYGKEEAPPPMRSGGPWLGGGVGGSYGRGGSVWKRGVGGKRRRGSRSMRRGAKKRRQG